MERGQLSRTPKNKAKLVKQIIQILFFAVLTVLAVIYILKDDPLQTFRVLANAQFFPLFGAAILLVITIILDSVSLTLLAKIYNQRYRYSQGFINTLIGGMVGAYVKSAAPILQAYTFTKQDMKLQQGASIMTMNYLLYQSTFFLYSFLIVILGYPLMKDVPIPLLGNIKLLFLVIIGLFVQTFFVVGVILLAFCRPLHRFILNTGINFMAKLHLLPEPEKKRRRLTIQFATYRIEVKRLGENWPRVIVITLFNLLKHFLLGSIPFLCFLALAPKGSLNGMFFNQSITATGYANVISTYISVGVPEIVFQDTFSFFLKDISLITDPTAIASAGNICWRSLTFYFVFILGLLAFICYRGSPKKYDLLSNTATIYDLGMINLQNADPETKEYLKEIKGSKGKQVVYMTDEELQSSFEEIKRMMLFIDDEPEVEEHDDDLAEILKEHQQALARAEKEYEELASKRPSKEEIQEETRKDFIFQKKKETKKRIKKSKKKRLKEEKRLQKELMKRQPKGSKITVSQEEGIQIQAPLFEEMKTITTHDPDEDVKRGQKARVDHDVKQDTKDSSNQNHQG